MSSPNAAPATTRHDDARAPAAGPVGVTNAMTVDVEDYFQVSALAPYIDRGAWESYPSRVERNIHRVLDMFAEHGVQATFFTLGWIGERFPELVRRIVAGGHELASHGFAHDRVDQQGPRGFRADVRRTKRLLEDVGGVPVLGYRAASFSVSERTDWAFDILGEEGYVYSSSVYPIRHDHYGMPKAPRFAYRPQGDDGILEVPITTTSVFGWKLPCGGGGYFRLLPYGFSLWALRRVNRIDGQPCVFYFHPWEIDPGQPMVDNVSLRTRVRHYVNLERMEGRLHAVLSDIAWDRMDRVFLSDRRTAAQP